MLGYDGLASLCYANCKFTLCSVADDGEAGLWFYFPHLPWRSGLFGGLSLPDKHLLSFVCIQIWAHLVTVLKSCLVQNSEFDLLSSSCHVI